MGMNHDFHLVKITGYEYRDYMKLIKHSNAIHLHDDFIGYIWDTLVWIPSLSPDNLQERKGLYRCGPSVITVAGAAAAHTVFFNWSRLLACGPEELQLTGDWGWIEGEPAGSGEYERLRYRRDDIVLALKKLADYADEVARNRGELYLLHLGI